VSPVAWFRAFSASEYQRRREAALDLAERVGASAVIAFGENRSGIPVTYLTGWTVTRLAWYRLTSTESTLWVQFHNHLPSARRVAVDAEIRDVDGTTVEQLIAGAETIATLGVVPAPVRMAANAAGVILTPIDADHARLRMVKSPVECEALRMGARASDAGARALIGACRPGATDWDLLAAARDAYTRLGARDHICYISITDMSAPDRDVPAVAPEGRVIGRGSVVTFELSAAVAAEYPGQVLRTVTIGEPTAEFRALHDVAMRVRSSVRAEIRAGVHAAALVAASALVEESGYTTTDDLFHGLGMGYLEPIGTTVSRAPVHLPDLVLDSGMAIVVQPNVTRLDHAAGVQTGEMVIVTEDGFEDIHELPEGLVTV
jgi:Xaa-Pro aminopeptidase